MGTVSSYVNDLRQIVKQSKINLCHGQGEVCWCLFGKKPQTDNNQASEKKQYKLQL